MDNRLIFRYRTGESAFKPEEASAREWKPGGKRVTPVMPSPQGEEVTGTPGQEKGCG
jgi:hypothetical protein